MRPDFDIAVIGAGAAGLSVANVAAQLGLRTALIERAAMGGDCLNTGCVPSKALLAAAHAVRDARNAARFGITANPMVDWAAVRAHVHGVIAAIAPADSVERYQGLGVQVIQGTARFISPDTLDIAGRKLTARRFVIAAGARAAIPPVPGLNEVEYLTNETMWSLTEQPAHLLVLGGGPIGLEMAQAFALLGSRVTVVEAGRVAGREEPELAAGLRAALTQDGVTIIEDTAVTSVAPGPVLELADGRKIAGSHLLVATGRRPNTEDLGLESGAVLASPRGVVTDRGLRSTSNRRVYAAGDIADPIGIGPRSFTHVCAYHAGIVVRRAIFRLPARIDYGALPRVIYTAPELAQVGLTADEARAAGHRAEVLDWPLHDNDRAQAERLTGGMARLVVTPGGRILGAGILAPHAGEMAGTFTLAISQGLKLSAIAGMVVPYPTLAEAAKRAAGRFFTPRLFAARTRRLVALLARLP